MTFLETLVDEMAIRSVVDEIDLAVDAKDWAMARNFFLDEIDADFTALSGGSSGRTAADDIVNGWRDNLFADKSSHHMQTNHRIRVQGDSATVLSKGYAFNKLTRELGDPLWEIWGDYTYTLVRTDTGWKVSSMALKVTHARGNEKVREFMPEQKPTSNPTFHQGATDVEFSSHGETLRGHLFLPQQAAAKVPIILVTGSWLTVKEQMPDLYARRLAELGYAALTFDFRFFGESSGEPRQYEMPEKKTEDIIAAIDFVASLPAVDSSRIGALSICASSGYMARAVATDPRIRSFVMVAPWLHNADLVPTLYGGEEGVQQRINAGKVAHEKYNAIGKVDYVPAASADDQQAAMPGPFPYYLEPTRGAIPQWVNKFAVMSWVEWLTYDAISIAPQITIPILMVHSEAAAVPQGAHAFYDALQAPKDILWTQGSQLDFYDQEPQVTKSVEAADAHFRLTLR